MLFVGLGSSGISISRVGLGGYELGPEPTEHPDVERAVRVIELAIESGINWLDTSENYLETRNESVIGAALQRVEGAFLVASKVAPRAGGEGGIRTLEAGISPPNALAGRRLQPLGHFSGRPHRTPAS